MIISRGVGGLSAGEKLHAKLTQAGVGPKRLEKQGEVPASSVKQDRDGVVVTLSIDPKEINALIQKQEDKVNPTNDIIKYFFIMIKLFSIIIIKI